MEKGIAREWLILLEHVQKRCAIHNIFEFCSNYYIEQFQPNGKVLNKPALKVCFKVLTNLVFQVFQKKARAE